MTSVEGLQQQIARLQQEQDDALQLSVYVGMSPAEDEEYDRRKKRIFELYKQLEHFSDKPTTQP